MEALILIELPGDARWSVDKRDLIGRLWPAKGCLTLALLDGEHASATSVEAILEEQGGRRDARRDASP